MRWISTRIHGVIDYVIGVLLLVAPGMFSVPRGTSAGWIPRGIGAAVIIYSLLTRYELGAVRRLPIVPHLVLDAVAGAGLLASPWILDLPQETIIPLSMVGLLFLLMSVMTETSPAMAQELTTVTLGRDIVSSPPTTYGTDRDVHTDVEPERRRRAG